MKVNVKCNSIKPWHRNQANNMQKASTPDADLLQVRSALEKTKKKYRLARPADCWTNNRHGMRNSVYSFNQGELKTKDYIMKLKDFFRAGVAESSQESHLKFPIEREEGTPIRPTIHESFSPDATSCLTSMHNFRPTESLPSSSAN